MDKEIIETEWGIENTYSDRIEINKDLVEYPELRKKILKHEFEHARIKEGGTKGFIKNRKVDALTEIKFWEILKFAWKRPNTWTQFLPITYSKKEDTMYFDWSIIFLYFGATLFLYFVSDFIIDIFGWEILWRTLPITILILVLLYIIKKLSKRFIAMINKESKKATSKSKMRFEGLSRKEDKQVKKLMK